MVLSVPTGSGVPRATTSLPRPGVAKSKPDASATRSGDPSYQHIRDIWARHAQYMWEKKTIFSYICLSTAVNSGTA